jgi:hypothetical protein
MQNIAKQATANPIKYRFFMLLSWGMGRRSGGGPVRLVWATAECADQARDDSVLRVKISSGKDRVRFGTDGQVEFHKLLIKTISPVRMDPIREE